MVSSSSPTGTVGVVTSSSAASSPAAIVVVVAVGVAVVVGAGAVVVVAARRAIRETSASISRKSSRSWMISTLKVSNSSSLVSKSPQPVAARERATTAAGMTTGMRVLLDMG